MPTGSRFVAQCVLPWNLNDIEVLYSRWVTSQALKATTSQEYLGNGSFLFLLKARIGQHFTACVLTGVRDPCQFRVGCRCRCICILVFGPGALSPRSEAISKPLSLVDAIIAEPVRKACGYSFSLGNFSTPAPTAE